MDVCEAPPPIGRPISNTQVYVLDRQLQLVPVGVPGQLYIGGDGLARGYWNQPELTAERFIPNPFSDRPGARLYTTGDLVRWLPEGSLEFLTRIDHQVKIRGCRVELGEVERTLAQHPQVREAVIACSEDPSREKRLVAYVVPRKQGESNTAAWRGFLRQRLPEYMVPSAFVTLERLPVTPNGKVDRRALPAPDSGRPDLEMAYMPPRTPVEVALARIWAETLGLEQVGIHDNFFHLGGHSLLAVRLLDRVQKVLRKPIPLATIFRADCCGAGTQFRIRCGL